MAAPSSSTPSVGACTPPARRREIPSDVPPIRTRLLQSPKGHQRGPESRPRLVHHRLCSRGLNGTDRPRPDVPPSPAPQRRTPAHGCLPFLLPAPPRLWSRAGLDHSRRRLHRGEGQGFSISDSVFRAIRLPACHRPSSGVCWLLVLG